MTIPRQKQLNVGDIMTILVTNNRPARYRHSVHLIWASLVAWPAGRRNTWAAACGALANWRGVASASSLRRPFRSFSAGPRIVAKVPAGAAERSSAYNAELFPAEDGGRQILSGRGGAHTIPVPALTLAFQCPF